MKKKILALCLVVVLAVTAVTGATLAYFTDAEQTTNTMVIGNIKINLDEWQYDNTDKAWEDYEDNKFVLYPIESVKGEKLNNKSVRTYNDTTVPEGYEAADYEVYMRSIILVEKNTELGDDYVGEGDCCFPGIHLAYDMYDGESYTWIASKDKKTHHASKEAGHLETAVKIGEKEYWVIWYVAADEKVIPVGEALSSLHSVYMDKNITNKQAEGWGTDGVQVIAFSQGVQAKGLNHTEAMAALGEVNETNLNKWLTGTDAARAAKINGVA